MADSEKRIIEKVIKLLEAQRELLVKLDAISLELHDVLAGKPGIASRLKDFQAMFSRTWSERYGGAYLFAFVKDVPQMKRLLKAFTDDDLHDRIWTFIHDADPFLIKARHSFALFVATINRHAPLAAAPEIAPCPHDPVCGSADLCAKWQAAGIGPLMRTS